jgi:hypothetical protein
MQRNTQGKRIQQTSVWNRIWSLAKVAFTEITKIRPASILAAAAVAAGIIYWIFVHKRNRTSQLLIGIYILSCFSSNLLVFIEHLPEVRGPSPSLPSLHNEQGQTQQTEYSSVPNPYFRE